MKGAWLVPLPAGLTTRQAMAIGTAGYTAMLSILALEKHGVRPGDGDVLVTGASGGVGSVAIAVLAKLGYRVVASTGRAAEADYLRGLGAVEVIDRGQLSAPGKPLAKERWAGVVDSVGSHTLANACASTRYRGAVAACGLAQGMDFPATVAPFILRGVTLYGIDSVLAPRPLRLEAWARLARDLDPAKLEALTRELPLAGAIPAAVRDPRGEDPRAGRRRREPLTRGGVTATWRARRGGRAGAAPRGTPRRTRTRAARRCPTAGSRCRGTRARARGRRAR